MNDAPTPTPRSRRHGGGLLLAVIVLAALLYRSVDPAASEPVYCPEEGPADSATVVMLATSWCPYCAKARKYLQKREVPYCEYDIEHSATGEALHQRSGHPGIPVIFIDGRIIAGYDPDALGLALQQRRTKTAPGATERISFPPTPAKQ
ncbi:MAG: glutaredoxin domain-containing protein [Gammaproteobacteria bacterium]|jgi:glutaredoxin|nr:glutaredoxin domain-containing protein [Gammaproteobacteria bacterium]